MRHWVTSWTCVLFFSAYVAASAGTFRYVSRSNLNPSPPYQTWAAAATNIQDAIAVANDGDAVIVQAGVYYENISFLGKSLAVSSVGGPGVTIIDGSHSNSVVTFAGGEGTNTLLNGFTITNGYAAQGGGIYCTNASPVITNCIISGSSTLAGTNDFELGGKGGGDGGDGAGIYASVNSSPMITDCIISNNATGPGGNGFSFGGSGGNGGGIACSFATILRTRITANCSGGGGRAYTGPGNGGNGGGIFCSSAVVLDSVILNNTTGPGGDNSDVGSGAGNGGKGGGIYSSANTVVERCTVFSNRTGIGGICDYTSGNGGDGGGIYAAGGLPKFRLCDVLGNSSGNGGAYDDRGGNGGNGAGLYAGSLCSPIITLCNFSTNTTGNGGSAYSPWAFPTFGGNGGNGGGIFCHSGSLADCIFHGNRTGSGGAAQWRGYYETAFGRGGAGGDGAGICAIGAVTVTSCLVAANLTGGGGDGQQGLDAGNGGNGAGVFQVGGTLANCTIWGNALGAGGIVNTPTNTPGTGGVGGGIWSSNGVAVNSILWNDAGREIAGSGFQVTYSDVQGGTGQPWFDPANCLDLDPQFANPGLGNWHLTGLSPCIEAGLNQGWMSGARDLDGKPRVLMDRVDMGAFEASGPFPVFSGMVINDETNCWLQLCAPPGAICTLQASTNLVNWVGVSIQALGPSGVWEIIDQDSHRYPRRYYRASILGGVASIHLPATSGVITAPFISTGNYIYQPFETVVVADAGLATYGFTITNPGTYIIEATVDAAGDGLNSFFLNIDAEPQAPYMIWDILPYTSGFEQRVVSWRGNGTFDNDEFVPKLFNLTQGSHQLIIRGREACTMLQDITIVQYPYP